MSGHQINLCFHGIGSPARTLEPGEGRYWISRDLFLTVLDLVAEDPRVRLSFDDGNSSDIEVALPALLERGLSATFFVLAGRVDQTGSLGGADLRHLQTAGMTIGSHGMDHEPWRGKRGPELDRELVEARASLEELTGGPVTEAALPLGRYDRRVLRRARELDYSHVHTSDRSWARGSAWLQPRYSLRADDTVDLVRSSMLTRAALPTRVRRLGAVTIKRMR